ncbi:HAL/PAL/TAL family ammonia-lyase [Treponema primitia]|uniref:HAL/PAL/TAL family ammonia-lyase n=1 Tax=Treponema primitia TaxID=88058 RepID=UPI0002554FA1|nr:aromatic amino acid ammonia-lyase [Treponema primitia]
MDQPNKLTGVCFGDTLTIEDLISVARFRSPVSFSGAYRERVNQSRALVEQFVRENRLIYGVTTGVGDNVKRVIPEDEAAIYQEKMVLTHCTAVGEPLDEEGVRAIMFMMLANLGTGYTGIRLQVLELLSEFLNRGVFPWAPIHGSVGYLGVEAHIALVLMGKGKAFVNGTLTDGAAALKAAGLEPIRLGYKEGLCLISGGTAATALAALAEYGLLNALAAADAVSAVTVEALGGNMGAFDERVMSVKKQADQWKTADHLRGLLADSEILKKLGGQNLQDALSLRCIPQAHGAARKTILDARTAIENEINSCDDNPIIHPSGEALSACNADAGFVGIASDSLCIAACYLAKIAERRTDRMVNELVSGLPAFLSPDPGGNSGYMILQYSSAGILGEMRVLAHPASIDAIPTCALQEDYVSMGYNAALKARETAGLLEYVIGNELLAAAQALELKAGAGVSPSRFGQRILKAVREKAPFMTEDHYISPDMEWCRDLVSSGRVREIAEDLIGTMD